MLVEFPGLLVGQVKDFFGKTHSDVEVAAGMAMWVGPILFGWIARFNLIWPENLRADAHMIVTSLPFICFLAACAVIGAVLNYCQWTHRSGPDVTP